jgi:hypothetical protein
MPWPPCRSSLSQLTGQAHTALSSLCSFMEGGMMPEEVDLQRLQDGQGSSLRELTSAL